MAHCAEVKSQIDMALSTGTRLGPYEILAPLGAGGMGEVYKARDTRLDRLVAIKVLAEHVAKRVDLCARFEREARTVASLNHPHICALFDVNVHDEMRFMVMELVDGETLSARLEKGAIPLQQALALAVQVADALDRAHRAGVIHRDLKPGNIMLTRDGVKVLDFGLAKSAAKPGPTEETLTAVLTLEGMVVGTPQYMAPEQFEGKEADSRSDIWAFGAVLYEMVTGQKAFHGKHYSSLIAAILSADPAPMAVKPFTPSWLECMVRRCLAKDPEDRYQSIRDVVLELKSPPDAPAARAVKMNRWPWAAAAFCLGAAVLGWGEWMRKANEPTLPVKLDVDQPFGSHFTVAGGSAISPDGRTLAFVAINGKGESLLHVRPLDSLESRVLPGTGGARFPFWSPDSKSLAFVDGEKLRRLDLGSGVSTTLCDMHFARGGTWSEEGVILFADAVLGLQRIPASGGTPSVVTLVNKDAGETHHYYPQFLPGGRKFLYLVRHTDVEKRGIYVGSLDAKPGTPGTWIMQSQSSAAYDAGSGQLLHIQGAGSLMARRLELDPPKLIGDPMTVAQGVGISSPVGYADFSISKNGTLFYSRMSLPGKMSIVWRDRAGKLLETPGGQADWQLLGLRDGLRPSDAGIGFEVSPDGGRLAYVTGDKPVQDAVWVLELASGRRTRIPLSTVAMPRWSSDGKYLYYTNPKGICRKSSDGVGDEELVMKGSVADLVQSLSPDGNYLLYGNVDIMKLSLTGERKPAAYLQTNNRETGARFSPDGRWVAYDSDESGRHEIYVQAFPDRRGKWPISGALGTNPQWRADGKELYWIAEGGTLMASSMDLTAAAVQPGRPEVLFKMKLGFYQPSRDGRRFLVYEMEANREDWPMAVQLNWASRLTK